MSLPAQMSGWQPLEKEIVYDSMSIIRTLGGETEQTADWGENFGNSLLEYLWSLLKDKRLHLEHFSNFIDLKYQIKGRLVINYSRVDIKIFSLNSNNKMPNKAPNWAEA